MKHSFRFKKPLYTSIFTSKLEFKTVSIENNEDVFNTLSTILSFTELDTYLAPTDCSYSYLNNEITFTLELNPEEDKKEFFKSVRAFEIFMEV